MSDMIYQSLATSDNPLGLEDRQHVVTYKAGGAISAGDALIFDISEPIAANRMRVVVAQTVQGTEALFAGIALSDAASGELVDVALGYVEAVSAHTDIDAGDPLYFHTTGGMVAQGPIGTHMIIGVALTDDSGGLCSAYFYRR
ncbi:MAG: DUF2190 family protein [Bacteroidetes bacterium]|nr:MAG: DUF2190 family protein [Bacteroidota bacterium]